MNESEFIEGIDLVLSSIVLFFPGEEQVNAEEVRPVEIELGSVLVDGMLEKAQDFLRALDPVLLALLALDPQ